MTTPYAEGRAARDAFEPLSSNPYNEPDAYVEWRAGWEKRDDELSREET